MNSWIDFKQLRGQLDFAKVLGQYGVELKLRGDQHHGFCPLPTHEGKRNSPSFSANLKRGIWQCFGCGQKGNVIDFAVLMERLDPKKGDDVRKVASDLQARFGSANISSPRNPSSADRETEKTVINPALDFELKELDATHPYLFERGFTKETLERFGLGYCHRGLLAGRIAIPLHSEHGALVGYAGRIVNDSDISEENPRYKFPGKRKRKGVVHEFRKSLLLYNRHRVQAPVRDLVVVEGFASVWWLTQAGIPNVVGLMGASCSAPQAAGMVSLLASEGRAWILTDGDEAGLRCATGVFQQLGTTRFVRWVPCSPKQQPTDLQPEQLRTMLPSDK